MYCKECKSFFEEPIETPMEKETGYVGSYCPNCGSDYIEETSQCKRCGGDTLLLNDFCDECMERLAEELEDLHNHFGITAEMLEDMICEHYDY